MKYETPELIAWNAIDAIQSSVFKGFRGPLDSLHFKELFFAYEDWE